MFCPNCGEKGHHIDFTASALDGDARPSGGCRAPKFEAYVKFPRCECLLLVFLPIVVLTVGGLAVLADIDQMPHDKNAYYRDLLRGSYNNYADTQLFPSLCRDAAQGGRFTMLPSYLPGRDGHQRGGQWDAGYQPRHSDPRDDRSRKRKTLNISSASDSEDSDGRGAHKRKKNYCAPDNNNSNHGSDRRHSEGGDRKRRRESEGGRAKPVDLVGGDGRDNGNNVNSTSCGSRLSEADLASKAEFDRRVEARKRRFGDVR